jgi:hypothetical protein
MLMLVSGCAPGNERFVAGPAGFWAGLWHGLICLVTFIISLFSDSVHMYEVNNTGNWYNFGFLLGVMIVFSSSHSKAATKKRRGPCGKDAEWEEIGAKVEEKVKQAIRDWTDEAKEGEDEWDEIGRKVEDKIKRELRNWAEK